MDSKSMTIERNRLLSAFLSTLGILCISILQVVRFVGESFPNNLFSILFLIVPILLFIFAYHKTPSFYVKETPSGLIITGAKQGLYDPDFIEFDKISGVEMNKNSLVISVTNQQQSVELYVPKKHRAELFDALKKRAGV